MKKGDAVITNGNARIAFHGKIIESREVDSIFDFGDGPSIENEFLVSNGKQEMWIHQDNLDAQ